MTEVKLKGLSDVKAALRKLPDAMAKTAVRRGTAAGARLLVREAKAAARGEFQQRTGATVRNIQFVRGKKPTKLTARYVVGVRHLGGRWKGDAGKSLGKIRQRGGLKRALADAGITLEQVSRLGGRRLGQLGMNPYYWRFLELGAKHMPKGKFSFLVPTLEAQGMRIVEEITTKMRDGLVGAVAEARR